jgi:iron complex transport system substrate-binding protein
MNSNIWCIIFCFLFIFYGCSEGKRQGIRDGKKRIISLAPHITEIIYELGEDEQLVAITDFCTYPPEVSSKEKIGGFLNPNIEKIVTLYPTHLFGQPAHEKLNSDLNMFGLSIVMMPNETIADIMATIQIIGKELGCEAEAKNLTQKLLDSFTNREKQSGRPRAMLVIGKTLDELRNITVAGPDTFLDELWQKAGGRNIYHDLPARYQTITLESIFTRDPEIIMLFDPSAPPGVKRGVSGKEWAVLKPITAFRKNCIYTLGGDYVLIPGPRLIRLARDMRQVIASSGGE